ncbi:MULTISPECIES: hypothetical protein [unclassified Phenylobacterium]|uniref:hypothetical protein n=1 Tax=unclassified Phenylobacterium TaxID=2640670 RepID=UPI000839FCD1|nr:MULTISPECIES: hypothetical protein [unclassified Phenylobacterium]
MDWQDGALGAAGVVGMGVAVFHGVLVQRLMVAPFAAAADLRMSAPIRRLIPPLLHLSTFNWFVGGLALIAIAAGVEPDGRLIAGLLVGSSYLFGAVANHWGTRGRHPGWMLIAVALVLIAVGVHKPA